MEKLYKQTVGASKRRAERALRYAEAVGDVKAASAMNDILQLLKLAELRGLKVDG